MSTVQKVGDWVAGLARERRDVLWVLALAGALFGRAEGGPGCGSDVSHSCVAACGVVCGAIGEPGPAPSFDAAMDGMCAPARDGGK